MTKGSDRGREREEDGYPGIWHLSGNKWGGEAVGSAAAKISKWTSAVTGDPLTGL